MATAAVKRKLTTTQKGLGDRHRTAVKGLRLRHRDGSPCDWCGRPMYLDRTRNWDYHPDGGRTSGVLHGDHSKMSRTECLRRGLPIPLPDRLLHGTCNIQRGEGGNDHLAAAHTGKAPDTIDTTALLMDWPAFA
jgi:hypothetical protein